MLLNFLLIVFVKGEMRCFSDTKVNYLVDAKYTYTYVQHLSLVTCCLMIFQKCINQTTLRSFGLQVLYGHFGHIQTNQYRKHVCILTYRFQAPSMRSWSRSNCGNFLKVFLLRIDNEQMQIFCWSDMDKRLLNWNSSHTYATFSMSCEVYISCSVSCKFSYTVG